MRNPLNRMFPFITRTWNPIGGGFTVEKGEIYACPFRCVYCWARSLINQWKEGNMAKKYTGPYRLHDLNKWIKPDDFVAVQFMSDIGDRGIPWSVLKPIFERMKNLDTCKFLMLTKNPLCYLGYNPYLSNNVIRGATIETDLDISQTISVAPRPSMRLKYMRAINSNEFSTFISIEPIMKFTASFAQEIIGCKPWAVAVGYDNYKHKLPEPRLTQTKELIEKLEEAGITVYLKTIREAWDR